MAFSASFVVGGLATYWGMNHSRTGFALDAAAIIILSLAGVLFLVGALATWRARHPRATSAQLIERQRQRLTPVA